MTRQIRNIAIIAHVDHGKTTLVDQLLRQSGTVPSSTSKVGERILDSNDLESERGITILAKNIAVPYKGREDQHHRHARPRRLRRRGRARAAMADGACCWSTPPRGRCRRRGSCSQKALELGLKPIVVVNKIDRPDAPAR